MIYCDIHTHHLPVHPEDVVVLNRFVSDLDRRISGRQGLLLSGKADNADYSYDFIPSIEAGRYYSVGIHPWYIYDVEEQIAELNRQVLLPDVVAIGETGLDKGVDIPLTSQQEVFRFSSSLAEDRGLFLIIHCVKAWDELIALRKELKPRMPWVIHGFRGNAILGKQLIRQGFYLSFGQNFNPEAVREAWPDRLFVETDDREIDIRTVYRNLSISLDLQMEQFAGQVAENIRDILHFQL